MTAFDTGAGEGQRACFVLSAGRTGTVFLANLLQQHFPEAVTVHEPFPARYEFLLANLRNRIGIGDGLLRWLFTTARRRRLNGRSGGRSYIELNPLLCPLTDQLAALPIPLHVVHLVREPVSWARSICAFGASERYRAMIDFVPFAKPLPQPLPAGWSGLGELERALWRWRFCNQRILRLRPNSRSYAIVRYEDLFASDSDRRAAALRDLLGRLPVDFHGEAFFVDTSVRANPAPPATVAETLDAAKVRAICGELMATFGYDA